MDEGALTWRMHILEKGFWYSGLAVEDIDDDDTLDVVTFEHGSRIFWSQSRLPRHGLAHLLDRECEQLPSLG